VGSKLQIRRAEPRDQNWIVEANRQLAWESEQLRLNPERLIAGVERVLLGQAEAEYWLAVLEGQPVGQLMLTREWSDWRNGWFYWIQSVYVSAAHRQQGVFRHLLESVREIVGRRPDSIGLRLYVEEHNMQARQTYQRLGFSESGYRVMELLLRSGLTD